MTVTVDVMAGQAPAQVTADALVVGVLQDGDQPGGRQGELMAALDQALDGLLTEVRSSGEARGEHGEVTVLHTQGRLPARRVAVVGLGKRASIAGPPLETERLRQAAGVVARALRRTGATHVAWLVPDAATTGIGAGAAARAIVEGTLLGLYRFTTYLSEPPQAPALERLTLVASPSDEGAAREGARVGEAMAAGTATARDLVNEPPNVLTPQELAGRATALAGEVGLESEVLGPDEMRAAGMGALLGVAAGSHQPPRLIVLRYHPAGGSPESTAPAIGLLGKGITFDTGGISIKPAADMHLMKGDMGGAAAVIGALHTVALLKLSRPVTGVIAAAENMLGGAAQRPGDVVRAMDGTTIEVQNTDAEGRLVLADALGYARGQGLTPLIDVATLTGAIAVALGPYYAGLFANDDALAEAVLRATNEAGERFWRMPLHDDYKTLLKSDCADMRNIGGREGGAISAATFIRHFAKETPWVHLDIAAVDYATTESGYQPKGGTGVAARSLAQFVLNG